MKWRLIKGLLRLVITLIAVATLAGAYLFYRAMPATSGIEKLPGLSADVRVWRDAYGVPHIFAASMDDAARALGYLHASERLFQMEIRRRVGQGRLAEILGPDRVGVDKFMRTLGFYREAESSFSALSPWAQKRLQAYADGVNAFLDSHRDALPPEFMIAGDRPEPWKPADSLVFGKLLAYQLSNNYKIEAMRARLRRKLGPEQAGWMFPGAGPGAPITTEPALTLKHAGGKSIEDEIGALIGVSHGASNEWVVAGSRTVTGKPILANDPHLALSAPILWYLARIVTPEGSVKGATLPGAPGVLLGQNDHIAWGFTTADTDVQDLFVETVDPTDPTKYLTPDGSRPFEARDETIHVKDATDVKLVVRATRHGPVLSDVSADLADVAGPGKVAALAFTGLGDRDTTGEAIMRLDGARNWGEFLDAMRIYQTPTQNVVYADGGGDIGFFSPGLVPVRKSGDGLAPVDGASGAFDWVGVVPFEQLPQLHNPEAGFAFNANNANVPDDHQPTFGQDWEEDFRARRIQQFFDAIDKHSLETSAAMQADHLSLAARDLQPFIAKNRPIRREGEASAGAACPLGRRHGQGPRRAADLRRLPQIASPRPDRRQDRPQVGSQGAIRRHNADFADARPSVLVRRAGQARPRLPAGPRPRARPGPRAPRQAGRRRHEPLAVGGGTSGADATPSLQPRAAARLVQRSQPAVKRRLLHSRPRRRVRNPARQAVRPLPWPGLSRGLRSRRPWKVALHDRDRGIRPYFLAPLSRPRPTVD